ncbi:putative bifunctional diguanylate cyclase/phosphodiesterase [Croceicoccus gelatinilyticus]|uniref:putative bifunctional diguanylate cyclase/phosphodiesterase n=1 Tax=Croceicoccus gelatinilyticus TaxID=2835536 RepID=UPI001BCCEB18|nr:EAL domain-containing protein [Croceicoccus gelatinilyticus]MBS7670011.1 EAL domain-containing protein [Croceicoccus gelatinilyticus]
MDESPHGLEKKKGSKVKLPAERDVVALGIIVAALIMFVGHAGAVLPGTFRVMLGTGDGPAGYMVSALLLNAALVIFGWRRYNELMKEVRERREAEEEARELAFTDPLTGSLNRRSMVPEVDRLIKQVCQTSSKDCAVAFIMLDLDHFKQINDLNGHRAGDTMLITMAKRVREVLPADAKLARLGGDEFACVMCYDPREPAMIDRIASAIISAGRQPFEVAGGELAISLSVGIACSTALPDPCEKPAEEMLHMADMAMYHAKKSGRNRYDWFEAKMERELRLRAELENGILAGIARGEFVPFYEQQVDVETGELTGFEMLARWQSPRLGLVTPDRFIPVAEELGVIAELSESVIAQALRDARDWDPRLTLSVNISPVQMRDPWFAQRLLKLMAEARFPAERLEIEITEMCLNENIGLVRSMVTSLKNQGVSISLDDFGVGYATLAQLRALPFDRIKIDRQFIGRLARAEDTANVISTIASIGEGMNLPVTAEGIETETLRDSLRRIGTFKGQGYFYGKPETAEQVRNRLKSEARLAADTAANDTPASDVVAARAADPAA